MAEALAEDIDNIRPVNPRFFGAVLKDPGLSITAKESLVEDALAGRVRLEEVRSALVRSRQQEQLGNLRIEREEFALGEARRRAQEDKEAVAKAGELSGVFTGILDNPELDAQQKRDAMARIRLENPDAFARNAGLRDQFATLDSALPEPPRPLTLTEQIARERWLLTLDEKQREEFEGIEDRRRENADRNLEEFEGHLDRVGKSKFKKPEGTLLDDSDFLDEFADPTDRQDALAFVSQYARHAGLQISPDVLENMGANALKDKVGEIARKLRPNLLREAGIGAGQRSGPSSLNIPSTLQK